MVYMNDKELRKEKRNNIFLIFIIIILLIIIFILLMQKNSRVCSNLDGKVDIFEVGCGENGENCKPEDTDFSLTISDDKKTWQKENKIDIFSNPLYNNESIIAPLSTNTYRFVVSNESKIDIINASKDYKEKSIEIYEIIYLFIVWMKEENVDEKCSYTKTTSIYHI